MDPSGTALAGLSSCLLSLWVWKKHGRGKPIPTGYPEHWWEQPWDNSQSNWEPEKSSRERQGRLQSSSKWTGNDGLQQTTWLVSTLKSLGATSGCPQEPSHHSPRLPLTPGSQLSNTCLHSNSLQKPAWWDTTVLQNTMVVEDCSEKAVFFYYQINLKKKSISLLTSKIIISM